VSKSPEYSKIFNRLCHMVALSKEGKTEKAIDGLVITVFVIDDGLNATDPPEVVEAIEIYFGLSLSEALIQASIDRHLTTGALNRNISSGALNISAEAKATVEIRIKEAESLEQEVREEWLSSIDGPETPLPINWNDQLWKCLRMYMAKAFKRHGAETLLLLDPKQPLDDENKKSLSVYLSEAVSECCEDVPHDLANNSVHQFFLTSTPSRTKYLAQLLDGTFTFFALSVDESTSTFLRDSLTTLTLFLDTNFIFGILNLHSNPLSEVSQELVKVITEENFPFKLVYHEETLLELQRTIHSIGDRLKSRRWSRSLSRAATQNGQLSGMELRYHEMNAVTPIDPDTFVSKEPLIMSSSKGI